MAEKLKRGDPVKVQLSAKHTMDGALVEHAAKFLRMHSDGEWADVELERHHSIDETSGQRINRLSVPLAQIVAALLLLFLFASPAAWSQDLGNVGLRTVDATLATNTACTGAPQVFSTSNPTFQALGFKNLGQTQHTISIQGTGTDTTMTAEIDGVDAAGNVYRISDMLRLPAFFSSGSLSGFGRFVNLQVQVTCTPGGTGTFSLTYSGSFTAASPAFGAYQIGQINKIIFQNTSAGTSQQDTIQTPFGNSAGLLFFVVNTSLPAGSTVAVNCQGAEATGTITAFVFTPSTSSGAYIWPVPPGSCPFVLVQYNSGGASAASIRLSYYFNPTGLVTGTYFYNPSVLGASALVEPGAGTSALTNPILTVGVKNATLNYSCTAGPVTVNVQEFSNDAGIFSPTQLVTPVSAVGAGVKGSIYIDSESNPAVDTGTLATPPAGVVRFPQAALAFSFTNAGGAGTCTARLAVTY